MNKIDKMLATLINLLSISKDNELILKVTNNNNHYRLCIIHKSDLPLTGTIYANACHTLGILSQVYPSGRISSKKSHHPADLQDFHSEVNVLSMSISAYHPSCLFI